MQLDYGSLAISLGLVMIVRVAITTAQWVINRSYKGLGLWAAASGCAALGFWIIGLRAMGVGGDALAVPQNALLLTGVALEYAGSVRFFGGRPRWNLIVWSVAGLAIAMSVFVWVHDDIDVRTVIMHVGLTGFTAMTALVFHRCGMPQLRTVCRFMTVVLSVAAVFYALRLLGAASGLTHDHMTYAGAMQGIELLVALTEGLLLTFGIIVMVNQRLNAEATEAREHFELIYETNPDAAFITRSDDGTIVRVNEGVTRLTGYDREELLGARKTDIMWADARDRDRWLARLEQGRASDYETTFRRKDGSEVVVELSAIEFVSAGVRQVLTVAHDITERKRFEEELELQATTDSLTGVANRRHFVELATRELTRVARTSEALSFVLIDIDRLKEINDRFGHAAGDRALRDFVTACKVVLRGSDVLARFGGDEFVMMLPRADGADACDVAQRVRAAVKLGGGEAFTVSLGVATREPGDDLDAVIARADEALYRAKSGGRDRAVCDSEAQPER